MDRGTLGWHIRRDVLILEDRSAGSCSLGMTSYVALIAYSSNSCGRSCDFFVSSGNPTVASLVELTSLTVLSLLAILS